MCCHALRHNRQLGLRQCRARLPAQEWICECYIVQAWRVRERSRRRNVVNVVALHALEERAKTAAKNGLAIPRQVIRESDARHVGLVEVLRHAGRRAILPGDGDAVQIELRAFIGLQPRADFGQFSAVTAVQKAPVLGSTEGASAVWYCLGSKLAR